jgi:hypothetical protein
MSLIRLSHRESWWKDAEILMVRHQLAVAQRPRVHARLTWPDRAWLALLAGTLPGDPAHQALARHLTNAGHVSSYTSEDNGTTIKVNMKHL